MRIKNQVQQDPSLTFLGETDAGQPFQVVDTTREENHDYYMRVGLDQAGFIVRTQSQNLPMVQVVELSTGRVFNMPWSTRVRRVNGTFVVEE